MKADPAKTMVCLCALLIAGNAAFSLLRGMPPVALPGPSGADPYRAPAPGAPLPDPPQWDPPGPQSAGPEWTFDLFTPPRIFFDAAAASFRVTPPGAPIEPPEFELELHAIERPLYRLQFQGYAGGRERPLIAIRDRDSGDYLLGRTGDAFPEHGFHIRAFHTVHRRIADSERPHGTPHVEEFIRLIVFDERTGEEIELDREPRLASQWHALFRERLGPARIHRLSEGEELQIGNARFTLREIDATTGAATLFRECPEYAGESRTLAPAAIP